MLKCGLLIVFFLAIDTKNGSGTNSNPTGFDVLQDIEKAYFIRDNILKNSVEGRRLIRLYYVLNYHFYASLEDPVVISKTLGLVPEFSSVINKLNNENYTGIIITETLINDIEDLLITSASATSSQE